MNYLIGTDIGTSGTKSIVMDTAGNLIASDLQEYDILTPRPLGRSIGLKSGQRPPSPPFKMR